MPDKKFLNPVLQANTLHRAQKNSILETYFLIDVASVELFADDGQTVVTDIFFPTKDFNTLELFSKTGTAQLLESKIWCVKPAF